MNIVVKSYESLLPFLVVEAISAKGTSFNTMSVGMIDKGWAWLVSGRRLLIWKFKETKSANVAKARRMLSPCFELQLPQSDLVHKAELVQVFFMPQNHNTSLRAITVPAALVVSPEGTIRFWSNIANERFTESTVGDMQGQEFCTMALLSPLEYLIGTTSGSIYILTIDITAHDPKNFIICSALNVPSGILSGFSRRVTNLFFGPMTVDVGNEIRRPLVAVPKYSQSTIEKTGSTDRPFFIMSSSFKLRQWSRTNEGCRSTNQIVREWDLQKNVFMKLIPELGRNGTDTINFWPIDMITTKSKELLILVVTLDASRENAIHYATCLFNPYQAGDTIASLTVLKSYSWNYSNESEEQLLALRFLERRATSQLCFMYDRKFLFLVQSDKDIYDARDYGNQDDSILGAGIIDGHPILFTQNDGLSYVVPVATNNTSRVNETSMQIEPQHRTINESRQHLQSILQETEQQSGTVDPMVIEIDIDVDDQEDAENNPSLRINQSHQRTEAEQSTSANKSVNQSSIQNKSLDQSLKRKEDADNVWRENKDFEWLQQIDSGEYALASETLARVAQESETLADWKETLLSLSKIANLAAD